MAVGKKLKKMKLKMIFRDRLYKRIDGGVTVFSPVGVFDLGDRVVFEVIKKKYVEDNPGETVHFFDSVILPDQVIEEFRPDKFFWADVSRFVNPPDEVTCYDLYREAEALREMGFYPRVECGELDIDKTSPLAPPEGTSYGRLLRGEFVVLHLRNVKKRAEKNVEPDVARAVFNYLRGLKKNIVLLGNDEPIDGMDVDFDGVIDLRSNLFLEEIAAVLKRAAFFVGSDSGIAHLAGACGDMPMAVWGFWDEIYVPKVKPGRIRFLEREESSAENILKMIERAWRA